MASCLQRDRPTLVYDDQGDVVIPASANDSTNISGEVVFDLPIKFDTVNILLHPVGQLGQLAYKGKFRSDYKSGSQTNFSISQSWENSISGLMSNVIFEDLRTGSRRPLTEEKIEIRKIHFTNELSQVNDAKFLIYQVIDSDTNQDKRLNDKDIKSLYISQIDGSGFQKLNKDFTEVIAWKILPILERLYFRTVEDTNKNGIFDKEDSFANFYCQLNTNSTDKISIQSYDFLEFTQ